MPEPARNLGKLISSHEISPVFIQRAAFVAVLSFVFFLSMMFAYYLRANIIYFLLATAFLLVYLVTMFSLVMQKRNVVKVHENGISYRKFSSRWEDIASFRSRPAGDGKIRIEVRTQKGEELTLPENLQNSEAMIRTVRAKLPSGG